MPNTMGGGEYASIFFRDPDGGTGPMEIRYTDDGSPDLAILGGNFVIGTTSPENSAGWNRVLDVYGDSHSRIITRTTNIRTAFTSHNSGFYGAPAGGIIGTETSHPLSFITGGSSRVTIDTSGNVGIGTTSPSGKLEIAENGVLSATDGNLVIQHPTSGSYSSIVFPSRYNYGSDYGYIAYYDDNNNYAYWGDSSENSALVIGVQNDGQNSVSDVVVLQSPAGVIIDSPSLILHSNRGGTGTQRIEGLRVFYAGDETQVSTTSTSPELKKQFTSVFDSTYGIKPRYINVIARIWNSGGYTTSLNVTLEGCNGIVLTTTSTSPSVQKGTINVASCGDNTLYPTKIYLSTSNAGGTAYNDLIEFYYVE
jgi:hypothetical protein